MPSELAGRTENMRYVNFRRRIARLIGQFVDVRDHRGDGQFAARPGAVDDERRPRVAGR